MTREDAQREKKAHKPNKKSNMKPQELNSVEENRELKHSSFNALSEEGAAEADGKPVK